MCKILLNLPSTILGGRGMIKLSTFLNIYFRESCESKGQKKVVITKEHGYFFLHIINLIINCFDLK